MPCHTEFGEITKREIFEIFLKGLSYKEKRIVEDRGLYSQEEAKCILNRRNKIKIWILINTAIKSLLIRSHTVNNTNQTLIQMKNVIGNNKAKLDHEVNTKKFSNASQNLPGKLLEFRDIVFDKEINIIFD
ncbi:hypothetical protein DMUE_6029 [Dictyocoela muelleri]|nr:hypothetical protein DMUE_6029 [Dictyocoela muelleri]